MYVALQAMNKYPAALFLGGNAMSPQLQMFFSSDIGSNIGTYTVAVAALRPPRKVRLSLRDRV